MLNHRDVFEVEEFYEMLASEVGASLNTIQSYRYDLNDFIDFIKRSNLNLLSIKKPDIHQYITYLVSKGLSERTRSRRLSALRTFYKFLLKEKKIHIDPLQLIGQPKQGRRLPKFLTEEETEALINAAYAEHPDQLRRIVLIELLYATGIRISEFIHLKVSDIEWKDECILVTGKGNKQRLVPFNLSTKLALMNYIQFLEKSADGWLFPNKNLKSPLTRQRFFQIIKELAIDAGLSPEKVSPHVIRHAFASHLLNHGANLINVQKLLGHVNVSTTEIYTHVMTEKLKQTVFTHHPLSDNAVKHALD